MPLPVPKATYGIWITNDSKAGPDVGWVETYRYKTRTQKHPKKSCKHLPTLSQNIQDHPKITVHRRYWSLVVRMWRWCMVVCSWVIFGGGYWLWISLDMHGYTLGVARTLQLWVSNRSFLWREPYLLVFTNSTGFPVLWEGTRYTVYEQLLQSFSYCKWQHPSGTVIADYISSHFVASPVLFIQCHQRKRLVILCFSDLRSTQRWDIPFL